MRIIDSFQRQVASWILGITGFLAFAHTPHLSATANLPANTPSTNSLSTSELATATQTLWQTLLDKYVRGLNKPGAGGVDYAGLKGDQAQLTAFLATYKDATFTSWSESARKAAYINLYNAGMMQQLLRYAQDKQMDLSTPAFLALQIRDLKTPGGNIWNGDYKLAFAGKQLNLDQIEHGLIRSQEDLSHESLNALRLKTLDPRIHAAVNCAALSCPRVREVAYTEGNVERLLDENMREYMSSDVQFKKISADTLRANQIVFWYYQDFDQAGKARGQSGAGDYLAAFIDANAPDQSWKIKHLKDNLNDRNRLALKLDSAFEFFYDWQINDIRNRK